MNPNGCWTGFMMFEFGSFLINKFDEMELIFHHEPYAFGISFFETLAITLLLRK